MIWPLQRPPVPDDQVPIWSQFYLAACRTPADPTILWGTDVPMAPMQAYLKRVNATSDVLVSAAPVLIAAVGRAIRQHPEFNRRVVRRRLYNFKSVGVLMPISTPRGPEVCLIGDVDHKPVAELAGELWQLCRAAAEDTLPYRLDAKIFRLLPRLIRGLLFRYFLWEANHANLPAALFGHRLRSAGTLINYLGFQGAPPMRSFKPSRFPTDACTLNVTMGPTEKRANEEPVAPLFVRADHRVVDAYQLGRFLATLRGYLADPDTLDAPPDPSL